MPAVGGSIESVSFGGRLYAVAADAGASRDLGGFTNSVESNGNGTARLLKTRKPWTVSGLTLEVDDTKGDQDALQNAADTNEFEVFTVTLASGAVYTGLGQIVDKLEFSTDKTTCGVTFSGPQKLTPQ